MTTPERHLVWFLRISAVMFLCATPFVFVPMSWMRPIAHAMKLDLPDAPLMEYLVRSVSAVYAVMGASYWFMSRDVRRYLPLLWFNVLLTFAFNVAVIAVDLLIPMPLMWTLGEAMSLFGWTLALAWLVRRVMVQEE